MIASLDGKKIVKNKNTGKLKISECKLIGENLAKTLLQIGGKEILKEINVNKAFLHMIM